jgi:hypothetical protein
MSALRHLVPFLLLLTGLAAAHAAEAPDGIDIEVTRSLANAGARHLALHRIDVLQPQEAAAPNWVEWERLRLYLLSSLGRHDEVLQRTGALSSQMPAAARAGLHVMAAHSALALGRTAVARDHAGRALWIEKHDTDMLQGLRLLIIRSYVRDASPKGTSFGAPPKGTSFGARSADNAYRSMLRFEQDHRPLDAATASSFVDALLDLKLAREAVAWLKLLDERGPVKLRLRLHTGVVTPQDAVAQARAALGRSEDPAWWRILLEAADRQNNGALRLAALEQLLETGKSVTESPDADAGKLWEAYTVHVRASANAHQLLAGDDASWLEFALRRRAAEAAEARAYLAYLARYARDAKVQQNAQIRLVAEFAETKLPRAGLRVFGAWPADAGALAILTRHTLGVLAENSGNPALALQYWQGLPAPDNMPAAIWSLRLCALALRGGRSEVAIDIVRSLATEQSVIPAAQLPEWIMLGQQFTDHGLYDAARALFERVLPYADAAQTRLVLSGIAQSYEGRGQPLQAADFYLRAALRTPQGGVPGGAAATEARMKAGFSLVRAGLRDDAKAQFEWLLKNASDPAQIVIARRELGF